MRLLGARKHPSRDRLLHSTAHFTVARQMQQQSFHTAQCREHFVLVVRGSARKHLTFVNTCVPVLFGFRFARSSTRTECVRLKIHTAEPTDHPISEHSNARGV